MTTKPNSVRMSADTMKKLADAGAAGNAAAAQAFAAEITASGTFAHLDTAHARAGLKAWAQGQGAFGSADDAANFVLSAGCAGAKQNH